MYFYNECILFCERWGSHKAVNVCMSRFTSWGPKDDPIGVEICSPWYNVRLLYTVVLTAVILSSNFLQTLNCWDCGSNPTGGMDVCRWVCVMSSRGLCDELITRPEESYRLVRRCVWFRNLVNEEALAHWGGGGSLLRQKKKNGLDLFVFARIIKALLIYEWDVMKPIATSSLD